MGWLDTESEDMRLNNRAFKSIGELPGSESFKAITVTEGKQDLCKKKPFSHISITTRYVIYNAAVIKNTTIHHHGATNNIK